MVVVLAALKHLTKFNFQFNSIQKYFILVSVEYVHFYTLNSI